MYPRMSELLISDSVVYQSMALSRVTIDGNGAIYIIYICTKTSDH